MFYQKKVWLYLLACIGIAFFSSCQKEKATQLTVQIDYIGAGGYYNDDIKGVPTGLIVGSNGPYTVDPGQTYTLEYKADDNFPVVTKMWKPTSGPWKIHCYVQGNVEYMNATPGN